MKNLNTIVKVAICAALTATVYIAYKAFATNDPMYTSRLTALIAVYIIVGILLVLFFRKKNTRSVAATLLYDNDPDKFIEECENKYDETKSLRSKQMYLINISAGYVFKNDFTKVLETLSKADLKNLGTFKLVYLNNLAYAYLMLDRDQEAFDIIQKNKFYINTAIRKKQNSKEFLLTLALYALKKKDYDSCLKYIELSKKYGGMQYTQDSLDVIKAWLFAETGDKQESEKILFNMINTSEFKGIRALAQNVFNKNFY